MRWGICKYMWRLGIGRDMSRKLILGVRALHVAYVDGIVHVNPEPQWKNSTPRRGRIKERRIKDMAGGTAWSTSKKYVGMGGLSAARDPLAFTPVLLDLHRVLCMLILMCTTRRPRAPAT